MANRIQYRRDTAAQWTSVNPILALGEPGYESDTKRRKIGDGTTAWTSLAYQLDKATADTTYSALAPGGNIQATVRKLADVVSDVKILVVGDSTAAQTDQWPDKLLPLIQARYPHRTYRKTTWSGSAYPAPTTVTAGSGSVNVDLYMGAVSGTVPETSFATWDAQVAAVQPDLIIVHTGHNYGATAAAGGFASDAQMDQFTRERFTRYVARLKESCPTADVMLTSQNPYLTAGTRTNLSNVRAQVWRDLAADFGCAYGPILEAYLAQSNPASLLQADLLHPTTTAGGGAELAANTLDPFFKYDARMMPSARRPSSLLEKATNLAPNGDFALFASPPTLTSWTALNSTLSKDTTNYESTNGYAVKIAAAAGTGNASAYASLPINRVKGKVITVAARIRKPAATGSAGARVQVSGDGFTTVTSGTLSAANDLFVWAFVTVRVPAAATFATITLLAGTAGTTDEITVDRVTATIGHLPHDV